MRISEQVDIPRTASVIHTLQHMRKPQPSSTITTNELSDVHYNHAVDNKTIIDQIETPSTPVARPECSLEDSDDEYLATALQKYDNVTTLCDHSINDTDDVMLIAAQEEYE